MVEESSSFIKNAFRESVEFAIILGTGHTDSGFNILNSIKYTDIPHFTASTVESHKGELILTEVKGKKGLILAGRFHYYEGLSTAEVAFPIRILKSLGVKELFITNAVGGLNPSYIPGDIVLVKDQINLQPDNPLRGVHDDRLGLRFPDMKSAFDFSLRQRATEVLHKMEQVFYTGTYVGLQGPSLETPAEYGFLNQIGGDLVGMSTVPEVIVAKQCEIKTLVISVVSNQCYPIHRITETTVEEVIQVVNKTTPKVIQLIKHLIEEN